MVHEVGGDHAGDVPIELGEDVDLPLLHRSLHVTSSPSISASLFNEPE